MPHETASFGKVLLGELDALRKRRVAIFPHWKDGESTRSGGATAAPPPASGSEAQENSANKQADDFKSLGVGLSGGGIRSATFNLGILQGLATQGWLPYIDYLSTVSGGGYIGTWLHGVILRKDGGNPGETGIRLNPTLKPKPGPAEDDPVTFLRKYSNYLAPKFGLFTADFWVIFTIWMRNMGLNWLILIPFLASLTFGALLGGAYAKRIPSECGQWALAISALFALLVAVLNAAANLSRIVKQEFSGMRPVRRYAAPTAGGMLLAGLLFFCVHPKLAPQSGINLTGDWVVWTLFVCLIVLHFFLQLLGGFPECFVKTHSPERSGLAVLHLLWMPILAGWATGELLWAVLAFIERYPGQWVAVIWGPPLIVLVFIMGVSFHIGLMGADFPDACREWLARIGAIGLMVCSAWLAFLFIAFYAPYALSAFGIKYGGAALAAIAAWLGSSALGLGSGVSSKTSGVSDQTGKSKVFELAANIAPTVFMVGLLTLISGACHFGLGWTVTHGNLQSLSKKPAIEAPKVPGAAIVVCCDKDKAGVFSSWFAKLDPFVYSYQSVMDHDGLPGTSFYFLLFLGSMTVLLRLRFNINEFSLHHFYKNRLVRCYLGAGNAKVREPNHFTGFDPDDDFPIAKLVPWVAEEPSHIKKPALPYNGPYAIVNATLNLNAGTELATQERKGDSFVFTPLYCGFRPRLSKEDREEAQTSPGLSLDGYCSTKGFFNTSGPGIGTAMGISGAAANPNWGYHTSAPIAFLLTIFNVRLGWWVGNPRVTKSFLEGLTPSTRPGPLYGLLWLIWELLGQTTGRSKYVNLSDGGHFENLGLYELVRRRCRYIIIGDGEEDAKYTFESLGGAARKCRADFGVEIDIDIDRLCGADGPAKAHCVVGRITYPALGEGKDVRGWILYLKSGLTGDEPEDVKQYKASHSLFPQESTMNQFFTESQFESYRRLGLHVVESAFENVPKAQVPAAEQDPPTALKHLFKGLEAFWYAPANLPAGVATKHAEEYSALMNRLNTDTDLRFLDADVLGKSAPQATGDAVSRTQAVERKAFFYILELLQLMENVWSDFHLESANNRDNPANGGWMRVFERWASAHSIQQVWKKVHLDYNQLFRKFFSDLEQKGKSGHVSGGTDAHEKP